MLREKIETETNPTVVRSASAKRGRRGRSRELPFDRHPDHTAPFGPRSVVVAYIRKTEQVF